MDSMENLLEKAGVLNEALPYIQKFRGKTIVVKYGGSAMVDQDLKKSVIRDVALLKLVGFRPVIVHGGGKEITKWTGRLGLATSFVNGMRVTDRETMEIAEMVLNYVNKDLVSMMEALGVRAVGISGKDGSVLQVKKKQPGGADIGYVGDVTHVDTELLCTLLDQDFVPVICPIGLDAQYQSFNVNADEAACAIAAALHAAKLVFLTDVEGVCQDPDDPETLISELSVGEAEGLMKSGTVGGGMLPKIQNCVDAIRSGVSRVHILDGRIAHCLLLEFYTDRGVGTAIIGEKEERFYEQN